MKILSKPLLIVIISLLSISQIHAKDKKIKYGKVSMEELTMKEYEYDTNAIAVVLYEKGEYYGSTGSFYHHIRIKILKKEGLSYASNKFRASSKGQVKGITFNLEDGKITESKLDKDNIYLEKVWDHFYISDVAMPNVKVGSVLDIEVRGGIPIVWYFQKDIPVLYSELNIEDVNYLTLRKQIGGIISPESIGHNHWKAEHMPAFISEPYLSSDKNYKSRIEIDINETHYPGYYQMEYTTSWKSVQTLLTRTEVFGKTLEWPNSFLNKYVKEIESQASTEEEKAKLAVEKIKDIVDWNENSRLIISRHNLGEIASRKEGNSADINLMLIDLLDKLNFEVYPMVMSTRDNGMLHPINPTLYKLNYVIAYLRINGEFMMLDATDQQLAWNMLPIRCLNYSGQVFDGRETFREVISPKEKYTERAFYDLSLSEDFVLSGQLSYLNKDYSAYDFRETYSSYLSEQDYVENLMDNTDGLSITDYEFKNIKELDQPVTQKYEVEIDDFASVIDDQLYLNMFLFEKIDENPFKSEERSYPVDFTYSRATSGVVRIAIPENFTIAELPKPVNVTLPEKSAKFTMIYQMTGNILTLNYKILINRPVFPETAYPYIKEFYAQILSNESKPVIFNITK